MKRKATWDARKGGFKKRKAPVPLPPGVGPRRSLLMANAISTQSEKKFSDVAAGGVGVAFTTAGTPGSWTVAPILLNGLVQGTTGSTRVGRKILMKSIYIRLNFYLAATTTGGGRLRVLVVHDKQSNGLAPAVTDILLANSNISPNNLSNSDRFVTIFDEESDPIGATSEYGTTMKMFKNLGLDTSYNTGNAGTIADISTGSVYLLFSQSSMLIANPQVDYRSRIRFVDQ